MSKKLRYGLSTGALKGTPPKWLSMATAIVALLIVAKHQLIGDLPSGSEEFKLIVSAWYDYIMEVLQVIFALAVIFTGYDDDNKPDTDYPGYSKNGRVGIFIIILSIGMLLTGCSKKTLDISREYSYTDSSWKDYVEQIVNVKGGYTRNVNMDSLKEVLRAYMEQQNKYNLEHPGINTLPPNITNEIYTISDTSGNYELQYWMNSTGELMARCVGKDQAISTLVEQNNRLIKKLESITEVKTVTKLPTWFKWLIGLVVVFFFIWIFKGYITKWLPKKS